MLLHRSGVDDLSDEELDEELEENHGGHGDNEGTSTELPSTAAEKVETDSIEADVIARLSDNGPVVSNVKTEDDKVAKSASPSPESNEDENQEIKDEKATEINGSTTDDKSSTENTAAPTLDKFEVSLINFCVNKLYTIQ